MVDAMVPSKGRTYPLKQPSNYKAPVTRYMLKYPGNIQYIYTLYLGIQLHRHDGELRSRARDAASRWLNEERGRPAAVDTFRVTEGFDIVDAEVWVAYWTDAKSFTAKLETDLRDIWAQLGEEKGSVGIWIEHFRTPIDRLETNYSTTIHSPGVSQLQGTERISHDLSAYWGAGRDRLPGAAQDLFEKPEVIPEVREAPIGLGERLTGTNYDNMCHIRSGQWWQECNDEEREAYEGNLQKTLMQGMRYLWEHPSETGTIGLRFLQNVDDNSNPIRETCGAGFFRNWADLEKWSSSHPSHLAIFNGAQKHAKQFGPDRKFMTWHEVSILKAGEVRFDYINCVPRTGVCRWVPLTREELSL